MEEKRKSELEMALIKMSHLAKSMPPVMKKANWSTQSSKLSQVSPTSALGFEWETVKNNFGKRRKIKRKQLRLDEGGSLPSLATSNIIAFKRYQILKWMKLVVKIPSLELSLRNTNHLR